MNASGRGLRFGLVGVENEIVVDARSAAPGRLSYSMQGPGNVDIFSKEFKNGVYKIGRFDYQTLMDVLNQDS